MRTGQGVTRAVGFLLALAALLWLATALVENF
jgi:hypothetical protein